MTKMIYLALAIALTPFAKADPSCPTDAIKPFVGQWQGHALLIPAGNGAQQQSGTNDFFAVVDCRSFKVSINYVDDAGKTVRTLNLDATPDKSGQSGLFAVNGSIIEGPVVSGMVGSFRVIQDGTLLGSFTGTVGGQIADLNELMNLTAPPNGESQLVRTIQMFAGQRGGPYIGTRVVHENRIR